MTTPAFTPGTTLVNPFNRETFIFTKPESPEVAEFEVRLGPGGSGGGNALAHMHPKADEEFTVRSGRLNVSINGVSHTLGPGETITVPRGSVHFFVNAHKGDTELVIRFRPGQSHLRFFFAFATATQTHPEWFGPKGEPNLLGMALALHTFKDHRYLAGPPIWLQKLLFAALSPIARLAGYRALVTP
jgi:quercetin dioxygenase-like cupin family protein